MSAPDLERAILDLLEQRGPGKTICPSEAARKAYPDKWREKMDDVREAAVSLAEAERIGILKKGEPVDPKDFRGAIRLELGKFKRSDKPNHLLLIYENSLNYCQYG